MRATVISPRPGSDTVKGMGCTAAKVASEDSGKLALARIYGKASGLKYQADTRSEGNFHCAFVGNFEGVNLETGEVYRSGVLYLPKGISEIMESTFKKLKAEAEKEGASADTVSITFAFEIRSVKASNPIGYSYEAQALKNAEKDDELKELRALMASLPATGAKIPAGGGKALTGQTARK